MEKEEKKIKKRRGIILVLSGGGARGLAHIGVLEILQENKIPIKMIVGTSAGALVGGIYCAGKLEELKRAFLNLKKWDVFKALFSIPTFEYLFNSKKIESRLEEFTKGVNIENLKIPFIAVAFNISEGKRVLFKKGKLFDAIRSSISMPGYFKPFKLGEAILVDGGVMDILPVGIARKYDKKGKIIAVNVEAHAIKGIKNYNFFNIANYSSYIQTSNLAKFQEMGADIVIRPNVPFGTFEFDKADKLILEGRRATKRALPAIKKLFEEN